MRVYTNILKIITSYIFVVSLWSCENSSRSQGASVETEQQEMQNNEEEQMRKEINEKRQREYEEIKQRFDVEMAKLWLYNKYAYSEEITENTEINRIMPEYVIKNGEIVEKEKPKEYTIRGAGLQNINIELLVGKSDFIENTWFHIEGIYCIMRDYKTLSEEYQSFYVNLKKLGNKYAIKEKIDEN